MKKKCLKSISLVLTAAMVLSISNPGSVVSAATGNVSAAVQETMMETESVERTTEMENKSETDCSERASLTKQYDVSECVASSIEDVIKNYGTDTSETMSAEKEFSEITEQQEVSVKVDKKSTIASVEATDLLANVIENTTLLEMVVDVYNTNQQTELSMAEITVGDLAEYTGILDFSGATAEQIKAVTSVKGLGAAVEATAIDISAFTNVTSIADNEFESCAFTSFIMPETIKSIGSNAFDSCTQLESIILPDALEEIGEAAFNKCSAVTSIHTTSIENTLPVGLTYVGQKAFLGNSSLVEINIPSFTEVSVIESAVGLFSGCTSLTRITIGENVKTIPVDAFRSAGTLGEGVTITFNSGLDKILNDAFNGAKLADGIIDLSMCSKLTGIAAGAFQETQDLSTVILPESVSSSVEFGEYVFANTTLYSLYPVGQEPEVEVETSTETDAEAGTEASEETGTEASTEENTKPDPAACVIYLPDYTASKIGAGAFYGNTTMTAVSLPASLGEIPDYLFDGCTALTDVEQRGESEVTLIGDCAFRGTAITNTDFMLRMNKLKQIGRQIHEKYVMVNENEVESLPLGGINLTTKAYDVSDITQKKFNNKNVGSEVFTNCSKLTSVTIPSSVEVIAQRAFYFSTNIPSVVENIAWKSASVGIVELERKIYPEAFRGNIASEKLELPRNINETLAIGAAAFKDNWSLTTIEYADKLDSTLPNTLPNTISYIGVAAFLNCMMLPEVHVLSTYEGVPTLEMQVFEGCWSLQTATLPTEITEIPKHFFAACPLTSFNFEDMTELTLIDALAFLGHHFEILDLSNCVQLQEIGAHAFSRHDLLIKTYIKDYTVQVYEGNDYSVLEKVILPDSIAGSLYLNTAVFMDEYTMTTLGRENGIIEGQITIPAYVMQSSKRIFAYTAVSKVIWEADASGAEHVNVWTFLPEETFEGCMNVVNTKDVMPKYVQTIGKRAFAESSVKEADLSLFTTLKQISIGRIDYATQYEGAFAKCFNLATVKLPQTEEGFTIEKQTFKASGPLENVDLGSAVSLGESAFAECTELKNIDLMHVVSVGNMGFDGCSSLQTIDFGNLQTIGNNAFRNCSTLVMTDTILPDTLISIGNNAFENTTSIGEVTFGSGLTTIGNSAFKNSGMTKVNFKNATALTTIGTNAFEGTQLETFELKGTKVTTISSSMLFKCMSLTAASFGEEVEYISKDALAACPKLKDLTFYASTTVGQDIFYSTPVVNGSKIVTGKENGISTGSTNSISITVKTPAETIIPVGREIAFPYYVNEQGKSNIKYLRVYDSEAKTDLTAEEYFAVRAEVEDGYYKVANSNEEDGKYKVSDIYFTDLDTAEVYTLANNKKVDALKVTGVKETETTRNLRFEIVADIQFTCADSNVSIQSTSFNATYNVKVVDAGTKIELYDDNAHLQVKATEDGVNVQAVNSTKGGAWVYYDLLDMVETGSTPDDYNIVIETSNPEVIYPGAGSNVQPQTSYTTSATKPNSNGVLTTTESNKRFYLIAAGVGTATITMYPASAEGEEIEKQKKVFEVTVNSDVKNISLQVPAEYRNGVNPGTSFNVFYSYTNYFDQICSVEDMSSFNSYTNKSIVFESNTPDYVSVDQMGNVEILKGDTTRKTVSITVTTIGEKVTLTRSVTIYINAVKETATTEAATENTESKTESTEGKTESTEGKTESTEGKTESTEGKTESTEGKTESTEVKTESTEGKTESTEGKTESTEGKTESTEGKTESTEGKTESTEAKTESTEGKTESTEGKTESTEGKTESTEAKTESTEGKTESTESKTESTESKTESTESKTESIESKTENTESKPGNKPSTEEVKVNTQITDTLTGSKVTVISVSNIDLQGEVMYDAPADRTADTVSIPDTVSINGVKYKVVAIAAKAFKNNKSIKMLKVGKYVKTIGKEAFSGCTALTMVIIGDEVEKIDTKAFYNCKKLEKVEISVKSKLRTIGSDAFAKCGKLTKITLPAKVKTVGKKAFYNCKSLKTITIKSTVLSSVGKQALKNIHKKATIKVPKKKLKAYKKLLKGKGQKSTVKIKK